MYLLGFDIGSSSVKASVLEIPTGKVVASAFSPENEMEILAQQPGWAEQNPQMWIDNARKAVNKIKTQVGIDLKAVQAIGISYQMHGLVIVDKDRKVLRPAIIWCDSRAVEIGNNAFETLGRKYCLDNLYNSPGNFTASKLKWVQDNEPEIYKKIYKAMLPGDYFATYLTDELVTTACGLSEGIFWDYKEEGLSAELLDHYNFDAALLPDRVDTFAIQGLLTVQVAKEFGVQPGIPVAYRAGDQPNNAFSLNVLNPGEIAATAGTSGVVYGVADNLNNDPKSRINTFLHVNHTAQAKRLGVLLCINSTGILNAWLRRNVATGYSYHEMNKEADSVPIGSEGLMFFPFGNGAERMLENKNPGASMEGLDLNRHTKSHMLRAAQEGIAFSFRYGMEIMKEAGLILNTIKAGQANMFLSSIFSNTLSGISNSHIELYNTDGSVGAARGAGIGAGIYSSFSEAFANLKKVDEIYIEKDEQQPYEEAYYRWLNKLKRII